MKSISSNGMLQRQRPCVLIIDDDDDDLQMLSSSLEQQGVKTVSFNSGEKAMFYLQLISGTAELPVLVISDYNMPRMTGEQILTAIKTNNATKDIPVVMYTTTIPLFMVNNQQHPSPLNWYVKPYSFRDFAAQVGVFKDLAYSFMPTG